MRRPVAFDLSRLFVGAAGSTPRGIDRVDMGYARQFLADPDTPNVGLLPSLTRMGVVRGREAARLATRVERHWRESDEVVVDPGHRHLMRWLAEEEMEQAQPEPRPTSVSRRATASRYLRLIADARGAFLRSATKTVPQDSLYINVGQVLLGWPWFFGWLDGRPDVKVVLMMHDLIPVLYPEYSGPVLARHHARAVRTLVRRASAMIATSHASADELRDAAARLGRADLPFHVVPLPVDASLLAPAPAAAAPPSARYVVTVGILDQRKNHRLLLHVWRDMVRRDIAVIPKLVIVGSRGLRTNEIHDLLLRSPGLSRHVTVINGLSSPGLREVIAGAAAVLMPSFTEGFGLPVVEALSLGTPVLASDIPAHREVGGTLATYLDPLDGPGWRDAILKVARGGEENALRRAALAGYRPQSWPSYFAEVLPFLESL